MLKLIKDHFSGIAIWGLVVVCLCMWGVFVYNYTTSAYQRYYFDSVATDSDAVRFFSQFGWRINPNRIESEKIEIPTEFDAVYREYNKLQKKIGLDLEKYKGKVVERRTYEVTNHPKSKEMPVRGNIFLYNNNVVAGDIMSVRLDGFIHSLAGE